MVTMIPKKDRSSKNKTPPPETNSKPLESSKPADKLSESTKLTDKLQENLTAIKQLIGLSYDVYIRLLKLTVGSGIDSAIIYIEGLCDVNAINNAVIKTLVQYNKPQDPSGETQTSDLITLISQEILTNAKVDQSECWGEILDKLFSGDTILLVDGLNKAITIGTRKWADRGIQEATTEQVIRGSKDSFSETLLSNTMLLRRRIKNPNLQMEHLKIGTLTETDIIIAYIKGVVNPKLVEEVRKRLGRIQTDSVLSTTTIEEFIEDNSFSILPLMIHTERPDKTAAHILEGGVSVLVDGTPLVLILPITFWQFLYSPEDYYERVYTSIILRSLRLISLIMALSLPSFYVAVSSFHPEMIPIGLLEVIVSGRRNIPFPILIEVLIMEFILEIIREAGVRLPRNVGQAISIVGALVLGQAAIQAKLASPATVTIVAITAIANFTVPSFSAALSIRSLRFALLIVSGLLGVFGFISAIFILLIHLCSLRSFGVPFMAPFAPAIPADFKDTLFRMPVWMMSKRPRTFGAKNEVRQGADLKPGPFKDEKAPKGGQ